MKLDFEKLGLSSLYERIVERIDDLGDGETMLTFDYDRLHEFSCPLSGLGWKALKRFSFGNTDGTFYTNENGHTLYVYANAGVPFGRAVLDAKLPSGDNEVGEPIYNDTVFYQPYNNPKTGGGMTYLIRMKDGSFIVIDGGYALDGAGLLRIMEELHPHIGEGEPFKVAAWVVTHPHDDHIELLWRIIKDEAVLNRLDIKRMFVNIPSSDTLRGVDDGVITCNDRTRDIIIPTLKARGCEIVKPYAGMSFSVGELTMNVLFTQAEWRFVEMKTSNDASIVLTFTKEGGKTVMITGDIMQRVADYILRMYTPAQLHAEVVQVAHHALIGPDIALYEAIAPKVCFWPIGLRGYGYTQYPSITERNNKLREMDVINCIACFGASQIVI